MGLSTSKRVVLYSAIIAGSALLACPTLTAAAVGSAAVEVAGSLAGNALATDIHSIVSGNRLTSLSNHHLRELVGRALAVCIECYHNDTFPPENASILESWIPLLRQKDSELSALAKAARKHWREIDLVAEHARLSDTEIHKSFVDHDRSKPHSVISASDWSQLLADLALHARTWFGSGVSLDPDKRLSLAEYIAPRFAIAVRELVKADLDPTVGTGGRVFVALHLDLMNALFVVVRRIEGKTDEILKKLEILERHNADLSTLVVEKLGVDQKTNADIFDLVAANRTEHETTRKLIADGFAAVHTKLDKLDAANDASRKRDENSHARLERIEKQLMAFQQANAAPATLSPEDAAFLADAKAHGDLKTRAAASVLAPDADTDTLIAQLQSRLELDVFDLEMLKGKRQYFANPVAQYDAATLFFERAVELRPADVDARNYAAIAHTFARLNDIAAHRRRAIDLHEGTLKLVPNGSLHWAATQNNLGTAWANLPTGDRSENLQKAIAAYAAALTVRTQDAQPVEWAMTQNNLGLAWQNMPTGDRGQNLQKAIEAYTAALTVFTSFALFFEWAGTQNNLGLAWSEMPTGNRVQNLQMAIEAYTAALTVYTKADYPVDWAMTQNNLGIALAAMPTGDRGKNLQKAIDAYTAALTVRTQDAHPVDWAATQNNLGIAWSDMPTGDRGENLQKAIAAFTAALTVRKQAAHPVDWAATQNNLGFAWAHLPTGDRGENLKKAIDACTAALTVYTKDAHPVEWAATQNNLGNAWGNLPTGDRGENLQKAIDAYTAALTVRTHSAHPVRWAMTQHNLAIALTELAMEPGKDTCGLLRQAIAASKAAQTIYTADAFPHEHTHASNVLTIVSQMYNSDGCDKDVPFEDILPAQ